MNQLTINISKAVQIIMAQKKLSISDLKSRSGMRSLELSRIISGNLEANNEQIGRIAASLDVSSEYLLMANS
ncbi:MAG: hypothetical protein AAGB30_11135 [Pedobacter sp.]|nr:hypothetical protein [Cellulomonas sp.]